MPSNLTLVEFRMRTVMPSEDVDALETRFPGFILSRLVIATSRIEGRLRKRYKTPFVAPVPEIVLGWETSIVTVECYQKRGWNPSDEQSQDIVNAAALAFEEIKEAAEAENGLFDLPLRADTDATGIAMGGPFSYSEPDAYTWTDVQAEARRG